MTRARAQLAWEKIVSIGFSNYGQLTREQRVWFNIEPLTTGGIIDHYINHLGAWNEDTIADLEYLGFNDIADGMRKINELFLLGKPPLDINERNDEIVHWDEKHDALLNEIEKQYWRRNNDIEIALIEHINKTGIGTYQGNEQ